MTSYFNRIIVRQWNFVCRRKKQFQNLSIDGAVRVMLGERSKIDSLNIGMLLIKKQSSEVYLKFNSGKKNKRICAYRDNSDNIKINK